MEIEEDQKKSRESETEERGVIKKRKGEIKMDRKGTDQNEREIKRKAQEESGKSRNKDRE